MQGQAVIDTAIRWRRYGYDNQCEFSVGIGPLLEAIDRYEGVERPEQEER